MEAEINQLRHLAGVEYCQMPPGQDLIGFPTLSQRYSNGKK